MRSPNSAARRASWATRADAIAAFVGVQPKLTQEPPRCLRSAEATHLFVATGRRPNTGDLGLETVGVKMSEHGLIEVDSRLATNVQGIWAMRVCR